MQIGLLGDGAVQPAPAETGDVLGAGQIDALSAQLIGRSLVQGNHEDFVQSDLLGLLSQADAVLVVFLGLLGVVGLFPQSIVLIVVNGLVTAGVPLAVDLQSVPGAQRAG